MLKEPGEIFPNWLLEQVKNRPQSLAVVAGGENLSFEELYSRVISLAGKLRTSGIEKGCRVAVLLGNSLGFVEMVHALMQLEAVLVPLNLRLTPAELAWQLTDVRPIFF